MIIILIIFYNKTRWDHISRQKLARTNSGHNPNVGNDHVLEHFPDNDNVWNLYIIILNIFRTFSGHSFFYRETCSVWLALYVIGNVWYDLFHTCMVFKIFWIIHCMDKFFCKTIHVWIKTLHVWNSKILIMISKSVW